MTYYTPSISQFTEGFEYEMKETFMDGTVKTQQQFDSAKWVKCTFYEAERPYVERALSGKNSKNNLCGIRAKSKHNDTTRI